ncbi:uncharacterized protein G2W53_018023 [Senna tora]|uniref:Uncharacterized protein n=1 Tax=Senna tora TaxID=362788 RepID=A0A834TZS9_9FABA|nr:uncharacterized protein G2W53_018023 [Senna tora]
MTTSKPKMLYLVWKLCWRALQGIVRGSASYDCKVAKEVGVEHASSYE